MLSPVGFDVVVQALLRADIDARITNLCDEALAQKQVGGWVGGWST